MGPELRSKVYARSQGRCEAEVQTEWGWVRCPNRAREIHHLLTRARGGDLLDQVEETYHLIHLCRPCHRRCDGREAYDGGMLIDGSCSWDKLNHRPIYQGTDLYLTMRYGPTPG